MKDAITDIVVGLVVIFCLGGFALWFVGTAHFLATGHYVVAGFMLVPLVVMFAYVIGQIERNLHG